MAMIYNVLDNGWLICGLCSIATLGVLIVICLFRSLGCKAFAPIESFLCRCPIPARIFLVGGLALFTYVGGSKPENHGVGDAIGQLMGMRCGAPIANIGASEQANIEDYFPTATNAVTNLACVGILNQMTSVVFGVRWPLDVVSATNGIDLYALDDLTRNGETNAWRWLGRAPVAEGESETLVRIFEDDMPDAFGGQMFFLFGFAVDSDGDGLTDAFERIVSKTNPANADTDGDGMPDGWEYVSGLNPFIDDSSVDTDDDGIPNGGEYRLGTCPTSKDTDGDGLDDLIEIGGTNEVFETEGLLTGGVILTNLTTDAAFTSVGQVDCVDVLFGEPIVLGGSTYESASLDPNGIIYLRPAGSTKTIPSCVFPNDYAKILSRVSDCILMPYWSRLNVQASGMNASEVTVRLIDGCYVITYKNMRFDPTGFTSIIDPSLQFLIPLAVAMTPVSFQTIINPGNSTVEYRYQISGVAAGGLDTGDYAKGRLAAIGARGLFGNTSMSVGFGNSSAINNNLGIRLFVASGTNPNDPDTDGDGMCDGDETRNGRDPKDPSDGIASKEGKIHLCFGDPSNTHSESYKVTISAVAGSGHGAEPADKVFETARGGYFDDDVKLPRGWKYKVQLSWTGSDLDEPDYDYVIGFGSANPWVVIEDPEGLQDCHVYEMLTTDFPASGKTAYIWVVDFDFNVQSKPLMSYDNCTDGYLIDTREALVTVNVVPSDVDVSKLDLSFASHPTEKGAYINDDKGTDISFSKTSPLVWETSTIYWYGIREKDRECHSCHWHYTFDLLCGGCVVREKEYPVRFPEKDAWAKWRPYVANSTSNTPVMHYTATEHPFYYCYIIPGEFDKSWEGDIGTEPHLDDCRFTWSGQYVAQIREEETFHLKQLRGEVDFDQGGAKDCFTSNGVAYFIRKHAKGLKYFSPELLMVQGSTPEEVLERVSEICAKAVDAEWRYSDKLMLQNRYFFEYKVKQHVNYNAAFKWECTYGKDFSGIPEYHRHPAWPSQH